MKINELKRIAEENDYEYSKHSITHIFTKENTDNYIRISSVFENGIWISNIDWCDSKDIKMIKAAVEFAETPLEDRVEEKKFYLKHRWIVNSAAGGGYLNWLIDADIMILSSTLQDSSAKTQFTLKEIKIIKERFDTDLADFELVEVVDEN